MGEGWVRKREGVVEHYDEWTWPEIGVFDVLCIKANRIREPRDVCELSARSLAEIFKCSRKTVLAALAGLETRSYIEKHSRGWKVLNLNGETPVEHDERFYRGRKGDWQVAPQGGQDGPVTGPEPSEQVAPYGGQPRPHTGASPGPIRGPVRGHTGATHPDQTPPLKGLDPPERKETIGDVGDGSAAAKKATKKKGKRQPSPVMFDRSQEKFTPRPGHDVEFKEWSEKFFKRWSEAGFTRGEIRVEILDAQEWCVDHPTEERKIIRLDDFLANWFRRDLKKRRKDDLEREED